MPETKAKASRKRFREEYKELVSKARTPVERPCWNPYWKLERRLEEDKYFKTFGIKIISKTLDFFFQIKEDTFYLLW